MKYFIFLLCVLLIACEGRPGDSIVGPKGDSGSPGVSTILEVIDPCGKEAAFDEVLIRTSNGQVFAYFESGGNRFLTALSPGDYVTTDGTGCYFRLNADGTVVEI